MSLSKEERQTVVELEYEKALRFFNEAEKIATLELWDAVANRIYYSLFHAVLALLIKDGHSVGTHKGASILFGKHYVITGMIPMEYGRLYSQLQAMREKGDYNCNYNVTEEEIKPLLPLAHQLLESIHQLLGTPPARHE